jgi:hypothetical protein
MILVVGQTFASSSGAAILKKINPLTISPIRIHRAPSLDYDKQVSHFRNLLDCSELAFVVAGTIRSFST